MIEFSNYFVIYFLFRFASAQSGTGPLNLSDTDRLLVILLPIIGALLIIILILAALLCWYRCPASCACCKKKPAEFQYRDIQNEKRNVKKRNASKYDMNRVRHDRTIPGATGVQNEAVIVEKDGRVKVMTPQIPSNASTPVPNHTPPPPDRFFRGAGPAGNRRIEIPEPSEFGDTVSIATTRTALPNQKQIIV